MNFASVAEKAAEKAGPISEKLYEQASRAHQAVRQGAQLAYRTALDHPRTSLGGVVVAAALVGGLLWYLFGDSRRPVQRRRSGPRVRAGTERRSKHRAAARARQN